MYIDNCTNYNKYEYNKKCYENCPNDSKIIRTKNQSIDKCLNDDEYKYEYNNECYKECPSHTYIYNETKFCYDNITDGFYCNNNQLKTLDKCHENCKTCDKGPTTNNNNCLTCPETGNIYFNLGNCTKNCPNGHFIYKNTIKMCKCIYNEKCKYCSEESNIKELCIDCNKQNGYYEIIDIDIDYSLNGFIDCFKEPKGYFLENEVYKKCYKSCKYCTSLGNENNHKCLECYENFTFINDFDNINNCFEKCNFYY